MASSSYYYNLYKQKMATVTTLENAIGNLRTIFSNLNDNLYNGIQAVNNEFDNLKSDLNKAVRHNSTFTSCANAFDSLREKSVAADSSLRKVSDELQEEITRVSNQKNQAIRDKEYYYNMYVTKKEQERRAFFAK